MGSGSAYCSSNPAVLEAWAAYKDHVLSVNDRRAAMRERFDGRPMMVRRRGFGHGTIVVGFGALDTDKRGDLIGDAGELRVAIGGERVGQVIPNLRRKAGRDLRDEFDTLREDGPELPGMPGFAFFGLHVALPGLHEHLGVVWAYWGEDDVEAHTNEIDAEIWERRPLSAYYADVEARDAAAATEGATDA